MSKRKKSLHRRPAPRGTASNGFADAAAANAPVEVQGQGLIVEGEWRSPYEASIKAGQFKPFDRTAVVLVVAAALAAANATDDATRVEDPIGDETDPVYCNGYRIDVKQRTSVLPDRARALYESSLEASERKDPSASESYLRQALALVPEDPMLICTLGMMLLSDRRQEATVLFEDLCVRRPEYVQSRCALATIYARDGNIPQARELMGPLLTRPRFHVSEFGVLCMTMITISGVDRAMKEMLTWMGMLEEISPIYSPDGDEQLRKDLTAVRRKIL
ncbi:MAG: tetratricopeptide repeat protein [Capsulimonadaceae bacterium]